MVTAAIPGAPAPQRFLQLLADPTRWRLLELLGESDRRVGELADQLGLARNLVSYHLGELRAAGLVSSRRSSFDGRDTYYRLQLDGFGDRLAAAGAALHPAIRLAPVAVPSAPRLRPRPRVLFVCTGNSARSQMAQALLEHRSGGAVEARSAGSHPKALHTNAVRALAERGIDIAGRPTTHLDRYARHRFDRVVTLCDRVREVCPELPGTPVTAHWSLADPAAAPGATDDETYPEFVRTADELETRVDLLLAQLAQRPPAQSREQRRHRAPR
jgi:protein-tyrosine-phosphatase/DNA-binding transcriptional ArsR family regulator